MRSVYPIRVLLIEGSWSMVSTDKRIISGRGIEHHTWQEIWNFLLSWQLQGFAIYLSVDEGHTIEILNSLYMYFSKPYLQTQRCFIVRAASPFQRVEDLGHARIAYNHLPIIQNALKEMLPEATTVSQPDNETTVSALERGLADAVYIDESQVISESLRGRPHVPYRLLPRRSARAYLAIAATFATGPEIGRAHV